MSKSILRGLLLLLAVTLLAFLVPSGGLMVSAFGEELSTELPVFTPVVLGEAEPLPVEGRAPYAANASGFGADGLSYRDESLYVQIYKIRAYDTPVFIAYIQIADPTQLRIEQAKPYPSKATARPDAMAKRSNAVVATNGDYFIYHNAGIVYRHGELLRNRPNEEYDGLIVDTSGNFHHVIPMTEENFNAVDVPVLHSFCFGPALVVDGEVWDNSERKVTYRQRTAIAQLDTLTYLLVVTDGPEEKDSVGLSIPQFSQLLKDLGAQQAYNLDGGTSSYMCLDAVKINGQKAAKRRPVGDIVYFATAVPAE